jgi:quercetin dioxygenase-like cupin family protein
MANLEIAEKQEIFFEADGSNFIEQLENIENALINSGSPDIIVGNSEQLPLTHSFAEGIYIREIFHPKGMFVIGKIHKLHHSFFLIKGKILLYSERGVEEIEAPFYGTASAGTKRLVIALEDTVFVNVFPNPNNLKEIEKLEDIFYASSYKEYEDYKLLKD